MPSLYSLKRSDMMLEFDYINIYIYIYPSLMADGVVLIVHANLNLH